MDRILAENLVNEVLNTVKLPAAQSVQRTEYGLDDRGIEVQFPAGTRYFFSPPAHSN